MQMDEHGTTEMTLKNSLRRMAGLMLMVVCLVAVPVADAQTSRIVKLLVGFPPGQATDLIARILAEQLGPAIGANVIVENKPGQGGSLALAALARAAPDGNTLMLSALASLAANPHLYKSVGYDSLKDIDSIAMVADLPMVLVVNPALPVQSLHELIAYAKANPEKLSHSSSGNGTLSHLGMEDLKRRADIRIQHVPYQGSPKAMTDLVAGNVQVAMDTVAVTRPFVQSGKLRALAVTYGTRLPAFTDVPTVAELGFDQFAISAWLAVIGPAGMPKDQIAIISSALDRIVESQLIAEKYASLGAVQRYMPPSALRRFIASEHSRWGTIVKTVGAKVD
jgi:tripartite-type tricarboxylate transporter receptor subunit TctC